MAGVLQIVIALIWLAGTCLTIYRQARFYQIEEYKSGRYARWYFSERSRWLPRRPVLVWVIGTAIGFFLSEAPDSILPGVIAVIVALVAVWPPDEGEIKKAFRRTPRATRILGAAFVLAAVDMAVYWFILRALLPDVKGLLYVQVGLTGLLIFLTTPLILIGGNAVMTPVEAFFRRRFMQQARKVLDTVQPVVIGVTGSYGKTTAKNVLAHILNGRYATYATPKSYNTLMGICLAINNDLAHDYSIEYFIVEMGAYVEGEIQRICDLTPPQIGMMVEVGPQHLERFGSLENTAKAKYELIKGLPPDGVAVFNWDNDYVREMYDRDYPATRLAVSQTVALDNVPENGPRFVATEIQESLAGLQFMVTDLETSEAQLFVTPVLGQHNVTNLLLATAVAVHEGMPLRDIAHRVRTLQPPESRLVRQVSPEGITIINDAYSANPAGVVSALRVLGLHTQGKRLLITPGMVELGDLMDSENTKLGEIASQYATDIILVGEKQTRAVKAGVEKMGFPAERLQVVETLSEAVDWYQSSLQPGDTVLFLNDLPDTY
jgi:UDP-N-acetylmuramoyl-tripeptide--D-alanyl-D-alanine ligase